MARVNHDLRTAEQRGGINASCSCGKWAVSVPFGRQDGRPSRTKVEAYEEARSHFRTHHRAKTATVEVQR